MKILLILLLAFPAYAAKYINVKNGHGVYDIEVIVFSRTLPQPPLSTISNKALFNLESALIVEPKSPQDRIYITRKTDPQEKWEAPVDTQISGKALVWYEPQSNKKMAGIWNKLSQSSEYLPLLHKHWRQPLTSFKNPKYVVLDQINISLYDSSTNTGLSEEQPIQSNNYSLHGKIALSQGRFTHLHVKVNLLRNNLNNESIIYAINEKRQIQFNQLNYFDHKEFGVIILVSKTNLEAQS